MEAVAKVCPVTLAGASRGRELNEAFFPGYRLVIYFETFLKFTCIISVKKIGERKTVVVLYSPILPKSI